MQFSHLPPNSLRSTQRMTGPMPSIFHKTKESHERSSSSNYGQGRYVPVMSKRARQT